MTTFQAKVTAAVDEPGLERPRGRRTTGYGGSRSRSWRGTQSGTGRTRAGCRLCSGRERGGRSRGGGEAAGSAVRAAAVTARCRRGRRARRCNWCGLTTCRSRWRRSWRTCGGRARAPTGGRTARDRLPNRRRDHRGANVGLGRPDIRPARRSPTTVGLADLPSYLQLVAALASYWTVVVGALEAYVRTLPSVASYAIVVRRPGTSWYTRIRPAARGLCETSFDTSDAAAGPAARAAEAAAPAASATSPPSHVRLVIFPLIGCSCRAKS